MRNGFSCQALSNLYIRARLIITEMEIPGLRTWVIYYLISFVVLLWAVFLSVNGIMLWVSLMLVIVVTGVNLWTLIGEIRTHTNRQALMRELSATDETESQQLLPPGS